MNQSTTGFIPFGDEWLSEMKKLNKDAIIQLFRKSAMENVELKSGTVEVQFPLKNMKMNISAIKALFSEEMKKAGIEYELHRSLITNEACCYIYHVRPAQAAYQMGVISEKIRNKYGKVPGLDSGIPTEVFNIDNQPGKD